MISGKNVIITGASRGLGAHIARAMWKQGAQLLMVARRETALCLLQKELNLSGLPGQEAHIAVVDLKSPEAIEAIMDAASRVWKKINVLVNNAGILGPIGPAWKNDWEEWLDTLRVNLLAPVELSRACIPWMQKAGGGKIINISGGGATGPRPFFAAYAVAKTGVVRYTEILAQEVKELNIQVNSIAPGSLNTDLLQTVLDAGPEKAGQKEYSLASKQAETGGADPRRAADLCVYLASSASDGVTGKLISAVWDPWEELSMHVPDLVDTDIYTLRRIIPKDRGKEWG